MPVVSATFAVGHAQVDGRSYVTERHTLHTGEVVVREYGPVPPIDYAAVLAAKSARIEAALAEAEFEAALNGA